jgi:hypothetical protein
MLIQEVLTDLSPAEVIDRAREFFNMRFSPYGGFTADEGPTHITFNTEAATSRRHRDAGGAHDGACLRLAPCTTRSRSS